MKSAILTIILSLQVIFPASTFHVEPARIYDEIPGGYGVLISTGDVYNVEAGGFKPGQRVMVIRQDPGTPGDMTDDGIVALWA